VNQNPHHVRHARSRYAVEFGRKKTISVLEGRRARASRCARWWSRRVRSLAALCRRKRLGRWSACRSANARCSIDDSHKQLIRSTNTSHNKEPGFQLRSFHSSGELHSKEEQLFAPTPREFMFLAFRLAALASHGEVRLHHNLPPHGIAVGLRGTP